GSVQDFYDWVGWNSDAVICGFTQAARCLGSGSFPPDAATERAIAVAHRLAGLREDAPGTDQGDRGRVSGTMIFGLLLASFGRYELGDRSRFHWLARKRGVEIMRTKFFALLAVFALAGSAVLVTAARPAGGSITGKVTFTGTPPKMKPIDMSKEPYCQKLHNPPIKTQDVEAGPGDTLEDAVVFISAGDQGSAPASTPVRYDQKGCQYIPHVAVMMVDQPLQ